MAGRPTPTRALDAGTFRSYYYNKIEPVAFCRANGLPVSGGKRELTDRFARPAPMDTNRRTLWKSPISSAT